MTSPGPQRSAPHSRLGSMDLSPVHAFPRYRVNGHRWWCLLGALLLVVLLFAILPAAQLLSGLHSTPPPYREVALAPPPPPMPPPARELPPPPEQPRPAPPRLEPSLTPLPTQSLQVELRPTVDASHLAATDLGHNGIGIDVAGEVERFTFADLNAPPRPLSVPSIEIPHHLERAGFQEGRVVLTIRIDTRGRVEVLDVIEASHRDLETPARRAAARALFEVPKIDGVPTEVYGQWPLTIRVR